MAKKKTVERSVGAASGRPPKTIATEVDRVRVFAERLRNHKELESRWAILHEARVEYFRGKDFSALLRNHADVKDVLGEMLPSLDNEDDLGNLLLKWKLMVRCDRVVKIVRPGKTKLSKWPARIELFPDQTFSEDDAFFAWTFERRRPLWQMLLSILLPVTTLACCLFPIFPHWCKLAVLYFCLTFLALICGVLFIRWAVFGILWLLFGWRIWFFPNILAEEATLTELFQFWPRKNEEDTPPKKTTRLVFALLISVSIWTFVHHAPDEAARARYRKKVTNIIDDVLVWKPNLAAITGKSAEENIVLNETLHNRTIHNGGPNVSEARFEN